MPLDNSSITHLRDFIGGIAKTIENFIRMLPSSAVLCLIVPGVWDNFTGVVFIGIGF